jgi:hypothetical protein
MLYRNYDRAYVMHIGWSLKIQNALTDVVKRNCSKIFYLLLGG